MTIRDRLVSCRMPRRGRPISLATGVPGLRWRGRLLAWAALGLAFVVLAACGATESTPDMVQSGSASGCGGFRKGDSEAGSGGGGGYCDAERLRWSYDTGRQELHLTNERVSLNCCGERSAQLVKVDRAYILQEIDRPAGDPALTRCRCMCVFDFSVVASPVPMRVIPLSIYRHVTDSSDAGRVVYQGRLDLSRGSGVEIVDDSKAVVMCY